MARIINLIINGTQKCDLTLDEDTFSSLTANPYDQIPNYLNILMENQVIEKLEILSLSFSLDNKNFCDITPVLQTNQVVPSMFSEGADLENTSHSDLWGEEATKFLLDKFENYLPLVGPMKRFKKKKNLWIAISEDLARILNINKTATQCENRYKTVMKRKRNSIRHNRRTGESPEVNPYDEEIARIAAIDDSIEPVVRIGVGKCVVINEQRRPLSSRENNNSPSTSALFSQRPSPLNTDEPGPSTCSSPSTPCRKKRRLADVMLQIAREKEEGRQQRHREKMEFLRTLAKKLFPGESE